jgi:Skp family chaperone for outer membrane proteins
MASFGVALLFALSSQSYSQAPVTQPVGNSASARAGEYHLGVVDIEYIFKKYGRFTAMMTDLNAKKKAAADQLNGRRAGIIQEQEKLAQLNVGTPEFKQLDEQIATKMAAFNLEAQKSKKEFFEQESRLHYQAYLDVSNAVRFVAERRNIGLVIRFNGSPTDPNNPEDIVREINKPVVFQNGIDITPDVIAQLDRSVAGPGGAGAPRTGQVQIPGQPSPR